MTVEQFAKLTAAASAYRSLPRNRRNLQALAGICRGHAVELDALVAHLRRDGGL